MSPFLDNISLPYYGTTALLWLWFGWKMENFPRYRSFLTGQEDGLVVAGFPELCALLTFPDQALHNCGSPMRRFSFQLCSCRRQSGLRPTVHTCSWATAPCAMVNRPCGGALPRACRKIQWDVKCWRGRIMFLWADFYHLWMRRQVLVAQSALCWLRHFSAAR